MSHGKQWPHWARLIHGERPGEDPERLEIWGYTGRPSYERGERVTFHVSTTAEEFEIRIYRDGASIELVHTERHVRGAFYRTPMDAYAAGCGWPAATSVRVARAWRSGGYVVEFRAVRGAEVATQDAFFVVRSADGSACRLGLIAATYTWQEYNDWGGGSGYSLDAGEPPWTPDPTAPAKTDYPDDAPERLRAAEAFSPRLSFQRPWARGFVRLPSSAPRITLANPPLPGWAPRSEHAEWALANGYSHWCGMAGWARHEALFVRWAEAHGFQLSLLTQWDLDQHPGMLDEFACVITVGHDEYWSATGRAQLDSFLERGGRYARFAGNILWQVRIEDEGKTQVCYKYNADLDPQAAGDVTIRTGAFESAIIGDPPVRTFGANGARGIYARMGGSSPRGVGGFIVYRNDHWAFADTDLYYADVLGSSVPLVGYEADGVTYTFRDGLPHPTGEDGAPIDLEILALTPASLAEEDHGIPGSVFPVGDGDLAFVARALLGSDAPDNRERVARGAAVVTYMRKGNGEVFCGGSTEWPYALAQVEPTVERVVENVLTRFGER